MGNISSRLFARKKRRQRPPTAKKEPSSLSTEETNTSNGHAYASPIASDYDTFLHAYPRFAESTAIDELRARDFVRLNQNAVYVDYMGGGQYPESLVKSYAEMLQSNVFGNTHSESTSSQLSEHHSQEARHAVLNFFDADPDEYLVVWTANATAGLKLVGESFPFTAESSLVLPVDAHNSVQGIRAFAGRAGSSVKYVRCLEDGGFDLEEALGILDSLTEPAQLSDSRSLLVLTGLSNLTNHKAPLGQILSSAHAHKVYTLLDAAALAPTTRISLKKTPVDAMVVSFYKMFGFPTGVGALVAKRRFLDILQRPWFAGGAVAFVQVPGVIATPAECISSRFEEGTINYLTFPAVTRGIGMLSQYIDLLPLRLSSLYHYLYSQLSLLRYPDTGTPAVKILTGAPALPSSDPPHGYVLSFLMLDRGGRTVPLSQIETLAARKAQDGLPAIVPASNPTFGHPGAANNSPIYSPPSTHLATRQDSAGLHVVGRAIALRTGCACNPGGAAALLGIESYIELLKPGATHRSLEVVVGRELGVIRVSLGWVSDWSDVHTFIRFVRGVQQVVG